jgi:hypothetical protein
MFDEIKKRAFEIQQPRSNFELERFVLGQHPTLEMQYYQLMLELQDMIYKYELAKIGEQKAEIKIAKLRARRDKNAELKAKELELTLEQTKIAIVGAEREINHLIKIWESVEQHYTREQIEAAQPDYWKERLTGNARAMLMGGVSVNPSHIEAMQQAGVFNEFLVEVEESKRALE